MVDQCSHLANLDRDFFKIMSASVRGTIRFDDKLTKYHTLALNISYASSSSSQDNTQLTQLQAQTFTDKAAFKRFLLRKVAMYVVGASESGQPVVKQKSTQKAPKASVYDYVDTAMKNRFELESSTDFKALTSTAQQQIHEFNQAVDTLWDRVQPPQSAPPKTSFFGRLLGK
jgi:hypothetical protein